MKRTNILLALWMTVAFVSCDSIFAPTPDSERELPPLTTDGENTFGCLINGEKFFPRKEGPFDIPVKVQIDRNFNNYLSMRATDFVNEKDVYICVENVKLGFNNVSSLNNNTFYVGYPNCSATVSTFLNQSRENFVDVVRLDTVNKIISGTFQVYFLPAEYCDQEYHLTDGRFDVEYTD